VTIPGRGDLAPPHRHVPLGRYVTVVLVLALLGGGAYAAYRGLSGGSSSNAAAKLPLCPKSAKPGHAARPPSIPQSKVTVYNASLITGLATEVAAGLKQRGFRIGQIGNAAKVGKGVATVRYSADRKLEATQLGTEITGSTLIQVSGAHVVELDINPKFTALAGKRAAANAFQVAVRTQHLITPTPTPTPTCRSHS
jgi:hypothetical protein